MTALGRRPAWQLLLLALGIVVGTLIVVVLVVLVSTATATVSPLPNQLHQATVGLPVVLLLYAGIARLLGVPAAAVRADRPGPRILHWVAVGLAFPVVLIGVELAVLGADVTVSEPGAARALGALAASLVAGVLAGVLEELALRGALLRVLESRWGTRAAVLGSAGVFALLHQGHAGSGATLAAVLLTMLAAGTLLGVATVRTGSVWTAVALHAGWNTVFGGRLIAPTDAVLTYRLGADSLLAGAEAGLSAAPLTTAGLAITTLALMVAPRDLLWVMPERPGREPVGR